MKLMPNECKDCLPSFVCLVFYNGFINFKSWKMCNRFCLPVSGQYI